MARKKHHKTKSEQQHLDRVAALCCVVCKNLGYPDSPAGIHHVRTGQGGAQRASHFETLPLCAAHHQDGGYGVAYHAGSKIWQQNYGTELDLLAQVRRELGGAS